MKEKQKSSSKIDFQIPEHAYFTILVIEWLVRKRVDGFTINENEPLPRDVVASKKLVDQIDFSSVWEAVREISELGASSDSGEVEQGELKLVVGGSINLTLNTYFEEKSPSRTIRVKVVEFDEKEFTPEEIAKQKKQELNAIKENAEHYLKSHKVKHSRMDENPCLMFELEIRNFTSPVMLWDVQSEKGTDSPGWWVINANFPIDHISKRDADNPREAVKRFGEIWKEVGESIIKGKKHPKQVNWCRMPYEDGEMIIEHAKCLANYSGDDSKWKE